MALIENCGRTSQIPWLKTMAVNQIITLPYSMILPLWLISYLHYHRFWWLYHHVINHNLGVLVSHIRTNPNRTIGHVLIISSSFLHFSIVMRHIPLHLQDINKTLLIVIIVSAHISDIHYNSIRYLHNCQFIPPFSHHLFVTSIFLLVDIPIYFILGSIPMSHLHFSGDYITIKPYK